MVFPVGYATLRRKAMGFLMLVFLWGSVSSAADRTDPPSTDDAAQLVAQWIMTRCDVGEESAPIPITGTQSAAVEAAFIEAARQGPGAELRQELEEELRAQWRERRALLQEGGGGLGPELAELLLGEPEELFVQGNMNDFSQAYREKAIAGLAGIATETALEVLRAIASDPADPLAETARSVLSQVEPHASR